jgi:ATP-binding cassette subfamily B protein
LLRPVDPERNQERQPAALRLVLRRYGAQMRRQRAMAIPAVLLPGVADALIFYAPPLVIARLLGAFARDEPLTAGALAPYIAAFAGVWLLGEAIWRIALFFVMRVQARGIEALYIEAMDELLAKDLAFFHDNFAGSLTKRAIAYGRRFEDVFAVICFSLSSNLLPLLFVGVVLWSYSPLLVGVLIGGLAGTFIMVLPLIRHRQRLVNVREAASNVVAGHVADSIANAEAVRAYAREHDEARIHTHNVRDFGVKALRSWDYQNLRVDPVTAPMHVLTNTAGLVVAIGASEGTGASLEAVFITFSYFTAATRVMWEFNRIYRNLESALADAAQFTELLLEPAAVTDPPDAVPFAPRDFSVEFRNVTFRYSPERPLLFERFSLRVESGSRVGLVGRSGGGKTTLTRLLLRFADVEEGEIRIGGQPVDRVSQAALRRAIAYVPQDPSMFHRSVADNIRVGRPDASDAEVERAARLAHAAEFIDALPDGYRTLVGERGVKLSGGQRQRMAIARAILKDAPILVLDEATSSLDSESEALIQDALWTLMSGRTAIVIAHRLSTVRRMDRLVVLDRGRIVEHGPHVALLEAGGIYASLWAHQSGGFLGDSAAK